ncbi:unnamed protein product [Zymoseptoria tritici ST99CH_3D7]|uniref:Uncharacterized protein n=1 Tax=Zymoseptoria tritici (strain ST99CH_3D7) TaxID=1276538 RepID=A0A1X7RQ79_ZYMT9|nr:unnamed protein product [Zymoseptoria tritici ST99CH_3D7]
MAHMSRSRPFGKAECVGSSGSCTGYYQGRIEEAAHITYLNTCKGHTHNLPERPRSRTAIRAGKLAGRPYRRTGNLADLPNRRTEN